MTKITVDAETAQKLRAAGEYVELCDPDGKPIGHFCPPVDPELYKTVKVPFTDEELERFAREPGGRSLEEIMADLRGKA